MRGLSKEFMKDLKQGCLSSLLDAVKVDDTLCLEIRENSINIYYRGGSLYCVTKPNEKYIFKFDIGYTKLNSRSLLSSFDPIFFESLKNSLNYSDYTRYIPTLKTEMDLYYSKYPKGEREFQQLVMRENTYSGNTSSNGGISRDTDYFIVDMEYAEKNTCRFDMIAVKWPSTGSARKNSNSSSLALIEMKYADGAHCGSSGIVKHFQDVYKFLTSGNFNNSNKPANTSDFYDEVENIFNQKMELGLIKGTDKELALNRSIIPEFIVLAANHKPASTQLNRELVNAISTVPLLKSQANIKIATASNMGYGLYADYMMGIDEYLLLGQDFMKQQQAVVLQV